MNKQGIFISVKDLMILHNCNSYEVMRRLHRTIRECLTSNANKKRGKHKTFLTVSEYCKFEDLNEQEVLAFLERSGEGKKESTGVKSDDRNTDEGDPV